VKKDLQAVGIYADPQDRKQWYTKYKARAQNYQQSQKDGKRNAERSLECTLRRRMFRREAVMARHKCKEREKPVCQQESAAQSPACEQWFKSRGGIAVHHCQPSTSELPSVPVSQRPKCTVCDRSFSRLQDLKKTTTT